MISTSLAVGRCMYPHIQAGDSLHWDHAREPKHGDIVQAHIVRGDKTFKIAKYFDCLGSIRMLRSETGLTPMNDDDKIVAVLDRVERPESIDPALQSLLDERQKEMDNYSDEHQDETIKFWSVYRLIDGSLTGQGLGMRREHLERNTPKDCGVVLGKHNHETHRVNLQTLEVEQIEIVSCGDIIPGAATDTVFTTPADSFLHYGTVSVGSAFTDTRSIASASITNTTTGTIDIQIDYKALFNLASAEVSGVTHKAWLNVTGGATYAESSTGWGFSNTVTPEWQTRSGSTVVTLAASASITAYIQVTMHTASGGTFAVPNANYSDVSLTLQAIKR